MKSSKLENRVLGNIVKDVKELKGTDIREKDIRSKDSFSHIKLFSEYIIKNPGIDIFPTEDKDKKDKDKEGISNIEKMLAEVQKDLGLDRDDLRDIFKAQEDRILLQAKTEVLSEKKGIKIGKKRIPRSLIKVSAYLAGTALISLSSAGLGAMAGLAVFRSLEKYISDKKDEKKIKDRADSIKKSLNKKDLENALVSSIFIKQIEKQEKSFNEEFFIDKDDKKQYSYISEYIFNKYPGLDSETRESLIKKYKFQLEMERDLSEREEELAQRSTGRFNKFKKFFSEKDTSIENKAIKTTIISGLAISAGAIAREVPVVRNVLGAYVGWKVGGLVDAVALKKSKDRQVSFDENAFNSNIKELRTSYIDLAANNLDSEDAGFHHTYRLLDMAEDYRVRALDEIRTKSLRKLDPERYLKLKKQIEESEKYSHLLEARFQAIDINRRANKDLQRLKLNNKLGSYLFKTGGALLGALAPDIIDGLRSSGETSHVETKVESLASEPEVETVSVESPEPEIEVGDSNLEVETESVVESEISAQGNFEEITVPVQKAVSIDSGEGVSKIFDGHMSSDYQVKFLDSESGESVIASASSKIVHPGDEVILGQDGEVTVICKQGIVDNPRYIDSQEPIVESVEPVVEETSIDSNISVTEEEVPMVDNVESYDDVEAGSIERGSDGQLIIKDSEGSVLSQEGIDLSPEYPYSDFKAGKIEMGPDGKLVMTDGEGNALSSDSDFFKEAGSSSVVDGGEKGVVEELAGSEVVSEEVGADEAISTSEQSLITESGIDSFSNVNEAFSNQNNIKEILGKDLDEVRVIKLSNGTGYSLQAPDGKMVNVSFPRAGGIRLEEGLDMGGGLSLDEADLEERVLMVNTNSDGSFSVKDFRAGVKDILGL